MTLSRALLLLIAAALLAGVVPAAALLDRRLAAELETRARDDLLRAGRLLADREAAAGDALMMHAKDLAQAPGLADAVARGDRPAAVRQASEAAAALGDDPVLVGPDAGTWTGPPPPPALVEATRRGEMPVATVADSAGARTVALAPVEHDGRWRGAAGVVRPLDHASAGVLAGLTRSDVVVVADGRVVAASSDEPGGDGASAVALAAAAERMRAGTVGEVEVGGRRVLLSRFAMGDAATVVFARDREREMAVLPGLRRTAALAAAGALVLALLLGTVLAGRVSRPVRDLAAAADRLSGGDFDAPLPSPALRELRRVRDAFAVMRSALRARLGELEDANRALAERQARLTALQSELVQRERLAVSGRMAAELAHEIRNPVAGLRNLLELIDRRLADDPEGRRYAGLAIDELLRMHELAERMLDLNRPRDPGRADCDPAAVAREVAALVRAGSRGRARVEVRAPDDGAARAALPPDALKQVLLNLVGNARDARPEGLVVEVEVRRAGDRVAVDVADNGPGVPDGLRERIFEPFVSGHPDAGGVGLGLSLADGLLRRFGGEITLAGRGTGDDGTGARFLLDLPAADADASDDADLADEPAVAEEAE